MGGSWPACSYQDWRATCDTLHAHTQVLGKLAAALAPPEPQLQHAALRLTARSWETAPLPAPDGSGTVAVVLDLRAHEAIVEHSGGWAERIPLTPDRAAGEAADPPSNDFIMRNAMDAQEIAVGWWPGDVRYPRAAFYAYAHPSPEDFPGAVVSPAAARWDGVVGEYLLDWDDVRAAEDPHEVALEFARSVFRHACTVCEWDTGLAASAEGAPPPVS